jgi:hypothetical protein
VLLRFRQIENDDDHKYRSRAIILIECTYFAP